MKKNIDIPIYYINLDQDVNLLEDRKKNIIFSNIKNFNIDYLLGCTLSHFKKHEDL